MATTEERLDDLESQMAQVLIDMVTRYQITSITTGFETWRVEILDRMAVIENSLEELRRRSAVLGQGVSATQAHVHAQGAAATTWTIVHNLGYRYPTVVAYDGATMLEPTTISYLNENTLQLTFAVATSGGATVTKVE